MVTTTTPTHHYHQLVGAYPPEELEKIPGVLRYMSRVLVMTYRNDTFQMLPELRPEWGRICRHYDQVGIEYSRHVIWSMDPEIIRKYPDRALSLFMLTEELHGIYPDPGWFKSVRTAYAKNSFIEFAERCGALVPKTYRYDRPEDVDPHALPSPYYLKSDCGAAGSGVVLINSIKEFNKVVKGMQGAVQLQEAIDGTILSYLFECVDGRAIPYLASEQLVEGTAHKGNRYPAQYAPWKAVQGVADVLAAMGHKGCLGFDAIEKDGKVYIIECNPRFTGAKYPATAAEKLGADKWLSISLKTTRRSLAEIDLDHKVWYRPKCGTGAVIINWGLLPHGCIGVLIIGDRAEQELVLRQLKQEVL